MTTDEGAIAIGKSLEANTSLEILVLDGNEIKDKGAIAICNSLKSNKSLTELSLSGCPIDAAGCWVIEVRGW